jgi:two-component system, LytTR family, sensor kinase
VRLRIAVGVTLAWLLIGVILGSQSALGMSVMGTPVALSGAVRTSLLNTIPWIPATWIVIAVAARFPLTRESWRRTLWLHLALIPVIAWLANALLVLGFSWSKGSFPGFGTLARQAALWGTVRVHLAAAVYVTTAALTQGWIWFRDARARELRLARLEGQLATARFQALTAQIRPHFLFNTLHTIGQLWRSGRADDADAMLDHLGALFQKVRSSTDRSEIVLAEEMAMVCEYLAIERARFPDRLVAEVSTSPEAASCLVPPLVLQPLVENAIRHGVSAAPGAGRVSVRAAVEGGRLVLEVRDDGPGMNHRTTSPGSGTGLANTRQRLAHAFGDDHAMSITSPPGGGTLVRLELPVRRDDDLALDGLAAGEDAA